MRKIEKRTAASLMRLHRDVSDAVKAVRAACAGTGLPEAIRAYETMAAAYNALLGEVIAEIEGYTNARSERWQDSDRAQEYAEWVGELEAEMAQQFDPEQPDALEVPEEPRLALNVEEVL